MTSGSRHSELLKKANGVLVPHVVGLDAFVLLHGVVDGMDFGRLDASLEVLMHGYLLEHRRAWCAEAHKSFAQIEEIVDGMIKKSLKRRKVRFVEDGEHPVYWLTQCAGTLMATRGVFRPYEAMIEIWRGIQTPVS